MINSELLKNLPNWLTYLRIALIPILVISLHNPTSLSQKLSLVIFIIAAITDMLDGLIARKFGGISDIGKLLDPVADKILVMSALIMMVGMRTEMSALPWVPAWMVVIILAREIWVTGLRAMAAANGIIVAASDSGKIKSFLQMIAITFLLARDISIDLMGFNISAPFIGLKLLFISIIYSIWGGAEYTLAILGGQKRPD